MTWIKIDDTLPNNPKILPLSDKAFRLYIEGLCYANQYLTDGFLPEAIVQRLDIGLVHQELADAGLWLYVEGGMQIHDYCEHQTSKAQIEAKRGQGRERVTRYRTESNAISNAGSNADVTLPEYRIQNTEIRTQKSFDEFWNVYPRKVGKREAEKAYAKALSVASAEEILAGAQKYATDPNRVDTFTAHPSTWLNQGRWSDAPLPPRNAPVSRFAPSTTPTPTPPRFSQDDIPTGVPMPDSVRNLSSEFLICRK